MSVSMAMLAMVERARGRARRSDRGGSDHAVVRARALDETTWPDFAACVERNNGVWGGCWCMGFHEEGFGREPTAERNRANKHARVAAGRAHAALVYDDGLCVGWCQFGSPEELPRIKHKRAYFAELEREP